MIMREDAERRMESDGNETCCSFRRAAENARVMRRCMQRCAAVIWMECRCPSERVELLALLMHSRDLLCEEGGLSEGLVEDARRGRKVESRDVPSGLSSALSRCVVDVS